MVHKTERKLEKLRKKERDIMWKLETEEGYGLDRDELLSELDLVRQEIEILKK